MLKKLFVGVLVVLLASGLLTLSGAGSRRERPVPTPPVFWPGVPSEGPLSAEELKQLPPPPTDTTELDEQLKAALAEIEAEAAARGLKMPTVSAEGLTAGAALQESLTDEQRKALADVVAKHEEALKTLLARFEPGSEAEAKPPEALSLEEVRQLERKLQSWQSALDADIEPLLTAEQFALYLASRPGAPQLSVAEPDLAVLSPEGPGVPHTAPLADDVRSAAEKGLPTFLAAIRNDDITQYGFNSADELAAATLGQPYEVFTMTPEALKAYQTGTRLSALLTRADMWYFPVMVGKDPRTILTVALVEGKWEVVDIGGLELPKNLARAEEALPGLMALRGTSTYSTKLVRVWPLYADFVGVESADGDYLVPIMLRPEDLAVENLRAYALDELLPTLGDAVEEIIEMDNDPNSTLGGGGDN